MDEYGSFLSGGGGGGGGGGGSPKATSSASSSTSGNNFGGFGGDGSGINPLIVFGGIALALLGFLVLVVVAKK